MRIEEFIMPLPSLKYDMTVRVMLPDGYDESGMHYPVLYMNDGQDVFRDEQTFWGAQSLRFERYYQDYRKFLPKCILVAISSPSDHALRTALYSPYTKDFDVPPGKQFESRIEGKGVQYLDWMTRELKPAIDERYRTRPEREYTAIHGYSTGALNAVYAVLAYPAVFGRACIMSAAVCIWMDRLRETLHASKCDHIKYLYLDVGTNEFGRMTTKEEFVEGTEALNAYFSKGIGNPDTYKYEIYPDAIHDQKEWRVRFPDALRWIFQDA